MARGDSEELTIDLDDVSFGSYAPPIPLRSWKVVSSLPKLTKALFEGRYSKKRTLYVLPPWFELPPEPESSDRALFVGELVNRAGWDMLQGEGVRYAQNDHFFSHTLSGAAAGALYQSPTRGVTEPDLEGLDYYAMNGKYADVHAFIHGALPAVIITGHLKPEPDEYGRIHLDALVRQCPAMMRYLIQAPVVRFAEIDNVQRRFLYFNPRVLAADDDLAPFLRSDEDTDFFGDCLYESFRRCRTDRRCFHCWSDESTGRVALGAFLSVRTPERLVTEDEKERELIVEVGQAARTSIFTSTT